jgi:hypothetical protein
MQLKAATRPGEADGGGDIRAIDYYGNTPKPSANTPGASLLPKP